MTIIELPISTLPPKRQTIPSLTDSIAGALAGCVATVRVAYRRMSDRIPIVRAELPKTGFCPELSLELETAVTQWISLSTRNRLTVHELDMPMTCFEADHQASGAIMTVDEIRTLRHDIVTVFRNSGRLADAEDYVDILVRVGLHSRVPLVQVLGIGDENPTPWEDLQAYGVLSDWVRNHHAWFAGIETLGLIMSIGGK